MEQGITIKGIKDLAGNISGMLPKDALESMGQGNMVFVEGFSKPDAKVESSSFKADDEIEGVEITDGAVEKEPIFEQRVEESPVFKIDYKSVLKKTGLVSDLDDFEIEGDDGQAVPLSSVDLDEDKFVELVKVFISDKEESLKNNMVSIDSLSDFSKKLIDLDKRGGDVTMILQNYADNQDSMARYDLNTVEGKLGFINEFFISSGMSADDAKDLTNVIASRGEDAVDTKVDAIHADRDALIQKSIEDEKVRAEEEQRKSVENHKKFKKGIRDGLRTEFQLNDKYIDKMVETASGVDKDGVLNLGRKFTEALNDPELSSGLILFLMDRDEYLKQKSAVIEKDINTKVRKAIKLNGSRVQGSGNIGEQDGSELGDGWSKVTSDMKII